jgi:hypothetical protein
MSPLRVVFGVVVLCFVAWLAALVFVPRLLPAFLLPSGFKAGGGGDDQPPIIISDGSVMLLTTGSWKNDGSQTHFVSDSGNSNDNDAAEMTVVVYGATNAGTRSCPYAPFKTKKDGVEVDAGTSQYYLAVGSSSDAGDAGKLSINHDSTDATNSSNPNEVEVGKNANLTISRVQANKGAISCTAPDLTTNPNARFFVLVFPHQ